MSNRARELVKLAQGNIAVKQCSEVSSSIARQAANLNSIGPGPSLLLSCRKKLNFSSLNEKRLENHDASSSDKESGFGAARLIPKLLITTKPHPCQRSIPLQTVDNNNKVQNWLSSLESPPANARSERGEQEKHNIDNDIQSAAPVPYQDDFGCNDDWFMNTSAGNNEESTVLVYSDNTFQERPVDTLSALLADTNEIILEVPNAPAADVATSSDHGVESAVPIEHSTPATNKKKVTRKRACTPSEWKSNKSKRALNSGEKHFNVKGQLRPEKSMRPACVCKDKKCFLKITEQQRLDVFYMFWKYLADKTRQWEYIYNHSPTSTKKTSTTGQESRRQNSRKYFLGILNENNVETKRVEVCKVMFTNTLSIGDGVIMSAHKHSLTGSTTPDKRGKQKKRGNKSTEAQLENIRKHINCFPRVPAHYVRERCQREYVQCGLSIARMADLYKQWCIDESIPEQDRGGKFLYRHVLNTEFNIGFFKPKKDQCELCNMFKNAPRAERETVLKDKWIAHIKNKQAAYEMQKQARKLLTQRRDVAMCTFDLQKVLPCPKSETSVFFYKTKLSVFNLTVYDVRTHVGKCYLWHEGIAKRGANDIGSCVLDHIAACAKDGIKEIHSFSDSCSGQNRNRFVYAMLLLASEQYSLNIRHCFLEPGHTYNEGDSVHARIEKASKGKEIFDLSEWEELIKHAKVEEPPYTVKLVKRSDIKNLKDLVQKQNWEKDTSGQKITWNKVKVIEAGFHGAGILGIQYSYGGQKIFLNTNNRRGHPVNLKTYKLPCAYQERVPLDEKTVRHLQELLKKAIPAKYRPFYHEVIAGVEPAEEELVDDPQVQDDCHDPDNVVDDDGFMGVASQDSENGLEWEDDGEAGSVDLFGDE